MNDKRNELKLVQGSQEDERGRATRVRAVAVIIGLTVLLFAGAQWQTQEPAPGQQAAAQPSTTAAPVGPGTFDYFPSQFASQPGAADEPVAIFPTF